MSASRVDMEQFKLLHELGFYLGYGANLPDHVKVILAGKTKVFAGIEVKDTPEGRRAFITQVGAHSRALLEKLNPEETYVLERGMQAGKQSINEVESDFYAGKL